MYSLLDLILQCHDPLGAVNVNIVGLLRKRFVAGKIGLSDLVTSDEGKERFKVRQHFH